MFDTESVICRLSGAVLFTAALAAAAPKLPSLFTDHMVLQRDVPVPVWGRASPGEAISVSFAGAEVKTTAAPDGRWTVKLPPHAAGGPFTLLVAGATNVRVKDVLVGEVWLASGQSNMTFSVASSRTAADDTRAANRPEIRLFMAPRQTALNPQTETGGSWTVCTPDTVRDFSAVAYHFGREIQRRLDVPVGIIQSAWAGTQAEEWTPTQQLAASSDLSPILERWSQTKDHGLGTVERPMPFEIVLDDVELVSNGAGAPLKISAFDNDARTATGGVWSGGIAPGTTFELAAPGHGGSPRAARVAGTLRFNDSGAIYGALTNDNAPKDLSAYSGIRFFAHGAGQFRVHVLQPSITDFDNYASAPIDLRASWTEVAIPFSSLKQAGWGVKHDFTPGGVTGIMVEPLTVPALRPPAGMYNGMITPLLPYAIRGAIWYQGEGNAGRAWQYRKLLPTMIQSWRSAWGEGDFPFLIVQLPNYRAPRDEPSESDWAELREAQAMTAATLPHTGMSVNIDLGEAADVHPHEKREVGTRLARYALGAVYGVEKVYSGPVYKSMRVDGSRVRLRFDQAGSGLKALDGGKLRGFAVTGADKKWTWADANIEGGEVVVSSPAVSKPVAVRYAWADNPEANLSNSEGLLASPFRTDDWPGITEGKR